MKLALVGTGRMGAAVERLASERGHAVVARFDSGHPLAADAGRDAFNGADVAIDFSLPGLALDHIRTYARTRQPAVVGTTGWDDARDEVRRLVAESDAALLAAPNFSIGVAVLREALRRIAPLLDGLPEFDVYVHEVHHTGKVDSPSGTAVLLAETLLAGIDRKHRLETETVHGAIDPHALHVSSTRAGTVYGRHTVGIDSPYDTLAFTHEAKSRDGFAFGALRAAEWLSGRAGFFTLDDLLQDILSTD